MEIENIYKGITYKTASIMGAADRDEAIEAVMEYFGETRDRLHDWTCVPLSSGGFVVTLWND